jgi:Type III secretion system YscX (type_III_YscX)
MSSISLTSPTVGLTSIVRYDGDRASLPSQSAARLVGRQVQQSVRSLYAQPTVQDLALDLTAPKSIPPELLQPQRFAAALLDTYDKVLAHYEDDADAGPAQSTLREIAEAWEQCRDNIAALNQV